MMDKIEGNNGIKAGFVRFFFKTMIKIHEGSILELHGYQPVSVSQFVRIAQNQYYLVEIVHRKLMKKLYAWQQKQIIKSCFHKSEIDFQKLLQKGKQIQEITKWPANKTIAVQQIRRKFIAQHSDSSDHNYQFQQELKQQQDPLFKHKIQEKIDQKSHKIQSNDNIVQASARKKKRITKEGQLKTKSGQALKQNNSRLKKDLKNNKNLKRCIDLQESATEFMEKMRRKAKKQKSVQYFKIKKMKIQTKKREINYVVQNILGESQFIQGTQLKKTHLYDVIVFLEEYLKVKK